MFNRPQVVILYAGATRNFGGMETLVERFSLYLEKLGCQCVYITGFLHPMQRIHSKAKVVVLGSKYYELNTVRNLRDAMIKAECNNVKVVIAMDLFSMRFAPLFWLVKPNIKSIFASVWVPNFGKWFQVGRLRWLNRWIFSSFYTPASRLVMLKTYIHDLQQLFGPAFACKYFPIPINPKPRVDIKPDYTSRRCVVVTRMEDIKSFVLALPGIAMSLSQQGQCLHFDMYGDGPYKRDLLETIERLGVGRMFSVSDPVENSELPRIFHGAFCSIGMGTVALEAGVFGVPTILAMPSSLTGESQGLLYEQYNGEGSKLGRVGPRSSLKEQLEELLRCSEAEYDAIASACSITTALMDYRHTLPPVVDPLPRKLCNAKLRVLQVVLWAVYFARKCMSVVRRCKGTSSDKVMWRHGAE